MAGRTTMRTRRPLGTTGLEVAPLCLGAMNFGDPTEEPESARMIGAACDALVPPGSAVADFHNTAPWMRARVRA